jgi:E3 SUMO-protein ligase NSE2
MSTRTRNSTARVSTVRSSVARESTARASTTGLPNRSSNVASRRLELPTYEPPTKPLTEKARLNLLRVVNNNANRKLQEQYKKAGECITISAGEINDVLIEKERRVKRKQDKRSDGAQNEEDQEAMKSFEEMQEMVDRTTIRMEEAIRKLIDGGQYVADMISTLDAMRQEQIALQPSLSMSSQGMRTRQQDTSSDDEDPDPTIPVSTAHSSQISGASDSFQRSFNEAQDRYMNSSAAERYSRHNDYIGFRRAVHDAHFGDAEQEYELPRQSEWFTSDNDPAPGITLREARQLAEGMTVGVELAVVKSKMEMTCPLTLKEFEDPVTSTKCPHSFERTAIMELINSSTARAGGSNRRGARDGRKVVHCPSRGCDKVGSCTHFASILSLISTDAW